MGEQTMYPNDPRAQEAIRAFEDVTGPQPDDPSVYDPKNRFPRPVNRLPAQEVATYRKAAPVASGVLAYFPHAIEAVARVSKKGNDQHNPGEPLHWAREKSKDETDALSRHLLDYLRGEDIDPTDGLPHLAKVIWRAMALYERWHSGENPGR